MPYSPQESFFPVGLLIYSPVRNYVNDTRHFFIIVRFCFSAVIHISAPSP